MADIIGWKLEINNPKLISRYASYIAAFEKEEPDRFKKFFALEASLGRIQGAKPVGKASAKGVPDFTFTDTSIIEAISSLGLGKLTQAEAKLKRGGTSGTEIGKSVVVPSLLSDLQYNTSEFDEFNRPKLEAYLSSLSPAEIKALVLSNNDLRTTFYNKSKFLQIFTRIANGPIVAYNFLFSFDAFKSDLFKITWRKDKKYFSTALTDSYEKALISELSSTAPAIAAKNRQELIQEFKKLPAALSATAAIPKSKALLNLNLKLSFFTGGSIPMSTARINYGKKEKTETVSLIDLTIAVRGRARLRMRRGSRDPYPPKIFERSGAFRRSIEAYANLKTGIINYFYEPYYSRLEKYGYEIDDLVTGSIRTIAQDRFNREFRLVRQKVKK
jgi:hypothetical protein